MEKLHFFDQPNSIHNHMRKGQHMEDAAVLATEGGEGSGLPACSSTPENCQLSPRGSRASHVLLYQTHLGVM